MEPAPTQIESSRSVRRKPGHLARLRMLRGFSQAGLARAAGVGRTTVARLESERAKPTLRTASRLSRVICEPINVVFPGQFEDVGEMPAHAPEVATVDVKTLRAIQADLPADSAVRLDVEYLIETAEKKAWPL
jgi:DNA-binding XRE family transcriptional regulator